jgi:hypothetical protein
VKRRLVIRLSLFVVLCLLLGAATTVGVAWGIGLTAPQFREVGGQFEGWPWAVPAEWGWPQPDADAQPQYQYRRSSAGRRSMCLVWRDESSPHTRREMSGDLIGWPWLALASVRSPDEGVALDREWRFGSYRQGFSRFIGNPRADPEIPEWLPVMPLWPGFALDSALYAGAWWLLIFAPLPLYRAGRRRFRVSRGMCGSCGYDLKGLASGACPECGAGAGGKA